MPPVPYERATTTLLGRDGISEAILDAPPHNVMDIHSSFNIVSFLGLLLGTIAILGAICTAWRLGPCLRRFTVSRVLRPRNHSCSDVRYKKTWYGWVKISPDNAYRTNVWKNRLRHFWKSKLSRPDSQWTWDPEANMWVPREKRWITGRISKWLGNDGRVKGDTAVDGISSFELQHVEPIQVVSDVESIRTPPKKPAPAITHRGREQKGSPLRQPSGMFLDGNHDSSYSQSIRQEDDDTASESDFDRINRFTSSENQSTESSMTGQSLLKHTPVKEAGDSSSWDASQSLHTETSPERKNYRSMPSMRAIYQTATHQRLSTIPRRPKALSEGYQKRVAGRRCLGRMKPRSVERLSPARKTKSHETNNILLQSANKYCQGSSPSHRNRPAYKQVSTQTRLAVPFRPSVRKRNHTRLHVRRRTNSSVAAYRLSRKYRAWSAKMQLQSWPTPLEGNRVEKHTKGMAGRPGSPCPEALKGMVSKCSTESSIGRGIEVSSLGFSQSNCRISNVTTEQNQQGTLQKSTLTENASQPTRNCNQAWLEPKSKVSPDSQSRSPWRSSLLSLPQAPDPVGKCHSVSDVSDKSVTPQVKSPQSLSTETTRRFIEELTDSEVKLFFMLARKLNWLSEELSPYRPPFGSFLPFSHWLNRDTWVAYDGPSRIAAGERRLLGDPKFGGPFSGKCNRGRNRKKQDIQNRSLARKRRPGSDPRRDAPLAPQRMGVGKSRKSAPSQARNLTRLANRASSSLLSSQVSVNRPITIPDGSIDTSAWIIPRPPQGLPRDKNERLIWYEGSGGVFETFEDWQNIGRGYKLKRFVSEGQVNRGRVREWVNNCAEGAKKVKRTLSDRAPTKLSREAETRRHHVRRASDRSSLAQHNTEPPDIEKRALSRLHPLQMFNGKRLVKEKFNKRSRQLSEPTGAPSIFRHDMESPYQMLAGSPPH